MDAPLTAWYCDACGQQIREAGHGMLEWTHPLDETARNFRIVHNPGYSPRSSDRDCYENKDRAGRSDWHLNWATGSAGLARLLNLATRPTIDPIRSVQVEPGSFIEIVARLHVPYYEEARRYYVDSRVREKLEEDGVPDQALRPEIAKSSIEFAEAEGIEPSNIPAPK